MLNQSFQQVKQTDVVLRESLRVGREVIVSFPNFVHYSARVQLFFRGRTPVTPSLPYEWHNTPNVHFCTVRDFREFCDRQNLPRVAEIFLSARYRPISRLLANWRAGTAIFQIERGGPAEPRVQSAIPEPRA